jgi:hypothetical protein
MAKTSTLNITSAAMRKGYMKCELGLSGDVEAALSPTMMKTTTQRTSETIARAKRWPGENDEELLSTDSFCPNEDEE